MAAGTLAVAAVATVLIVNSQGGGHHDTLPAANEVALQAPADPGPDPFTPSVETQGVSAPAPAQAPQSAQAAQSGPGGRSTAASPAVIHSVEGSSAGLYGGTMTKPSCDTERLIGMVSSGDAGRAWASAAGVQQSDVPSYLRSLTSAYLRVDTRVTNHNYKSGAVVEYQSALQAGTAVLVDAQGVPRVRCSCGNPLKPPVLVSDAKYTGKAWAGFHPTTLVVVVPAPQPVTEIILVNIETGGWFSRLTGRIDVVDRNVGPPKGPLAPGIPPPGKMTPTTPAGTASTSHSTSGATSASTSGATSGSGSATTSGSTSSGATSSGASTGTGSASATSSTSSGAPTGTTRSTGTASASTGSSASSSTGSSTTKTPTQTPSTKAPESTTGSTATNTTNGTTATTTTTTTEPPKTATAGSATPS
ncbi:DUF6777 domain-containing protein [Kitasatospora sp. NPDC088160]|uniref:DUF6777 domain-containing protein n=1 Tax=Kitasatospora sp. NPDC088160 TaxID=3364072 RepID=UPI0038295B68